MQGIESTFIFFIVVSLISLLISIASYRSHPEEKLFKWQCFLWASLLLMFTVQVVLKDESHLIINLSNTVGYLFIFALIKIIEFDDFCISLNGRGWNHADLDFLKKLL